MLPAYFALVATAISSLGSLHYLALTFKGEVKPNKVTFFFWGLFPMIAFFAQLDQEISSVMWITLSVGVLPFLILFASYYNPSARWDIKNRDYVLALIAVLSMVLWYVTKNSNLAIVFAILADFFAAVPTIIKSYKFPHSEDWRPYAVNSFGFFVGILAIQSWTFAEYSFVLYLFSLTLLLSALIFFRGKCRQNLNGYES